MDPQTQFCHNLNCPARGQVGQGNIKVHSRKERRYRCDRCKQSFAATKGTPFYRLQTATEVVTMVLTLLCHGCPIKAIVAAFGFDERTVARWLTCAGAHCQRVHEHLVQQQRVDLKHVQADEMWVKLVGKRVWMAMAMAVPSRLWLGGVISVRGDLVLITTLVHMIRACAASLAILVCVDGLVSYVAAFLGVFRQPVHKGRRGRPRLAVEPGLLLGQVVKQYERRRVVSVAHRVVRGTDGAISAALLATGGGTQINTAYIERLNATFRSALAVLVRRGRAIAHKETMLTPAIYLVGCAYNFCWYHESLRLAAPKSSSHKWLKRTPAMAAGLTGYRWSMAELLHYQIPLPAWVAPRRRGRPPKHVAQQAMALAA
jgi:transposase-like protein